MFFIVRSFLIPFGGPREGGSLGPHPAEEAPSSPTTGRGQSRTPRHGGTGYPSPSSSLHSQTQTFYSSRFPKPPSPLSLPWLKSCHLSPRNSPRLATVSLPPHTCPATKGIFSNTSLTMNEALASTPFGGSPSALSVAQGPTHPSSSPLHLLLPLGDRALLTSLQNHFLFSSTRWFLSHALAFALLHLLRLPFPSSVWRTSACH